jgi:hypothetical protein
MTEEIKVTVQQSEMGPKLAVSVITEDIEVTDFQSELGTK